MMAKKPSPESIIAAKDGEKHPCTPDGLPKEINGFAAQGLKEPTRYGDWDVKGRCSDF